MFIMVFHTGDIKENEKHHFYGSGLLSKNIQLKNNARMEATAFSPTYTKLFCIVTLGEQFFIWL